MTKAPRLYPFVTVDVFTDARFGGNPLAIFPDAHGLSTAEMQSLAAEMNYSETTFVLPPVDPANTARVRIFNRTAEMPFAGHPNIGTAFALEALGRTTSDLLRFEQMAGLVEVRLQRSSCGKMVGAEIDAPRPLQLLGELPAVRIAECIGVSKDAICTGTHPPLRATMGVEFVLVEVAADALSKATPDLAAYRETAAACLPGNDRLSILLYVRQGSRIRSRMFAPLAGTWEDPATGSANATLAALLLSKRSASSATFEVSQGVEMGRPSKLRLRAWRAAGGCYASVGGDCVPVLSGQAEL